MDTLLTLLNWLLPVTYLMLWAVHTRVFLRHTSEEPVPWLSRLTGKAPLIATLVLHIAFTILRGLAQQAWPLANKAEFFSLLAISVLSVWLFTERDDEESQTGIFFLGIISSFQIIAAALMIPVSESTHQLLHENPIYGIHALFMVLGFAALAVGAIDAIMYILLSRALKTRELGLVFEKLQPLMRIEEMSRRATVIGIFLLGGGLIMGHIVAVYVLGSFNFLDPKIFLTNLAWVAYLLGFIIIRLKGLGGLRIGYLSLGAFILLMLTVALSNLLLPSFHSFQG